MQDRLYFHIFRSDTNIMYRATANSVKIEVKSEPGWGLAVVGTKYSAHQTKVEKYSVDRLSLAGVWLSPTRANYIKNKISGLNILSHIFLKTTRLV